MLRFRVENRKGLVVYNSFDLALEAVVDGESSIQCAYPLADRV